MFHRRMALGLLGASAGLVATGTVMGASPGKARASASLALADMTQLATAFRKLAYSFVDSVATPFWDMCVGAWLRTRSVDDERYEVTMAGANFYTLPNSTQLVLSFRNPYTDREVPVRYVSPRASITKMGLEGGFAFGGDTPSMRTTKNDAAGPGAIEGDDGIIRGDMILNAKPLDPLGGAKLLIMQGFSMYIGKLADLVEPRVRNAPASLQMGDQPGSYVSRCYGRKAFCYAQMPATWRRLREQVLPEVARDPAAELKAAR